MSAGEERPAAYRQGFREFVREWVYTTFLMPSREECQRMWDEGDPVTILTVNEVRHSSLCAITASGHRGPCTCGADRG